MEFVKLFRERFVRTLFFASTRLPALELVCTWVRIAFVTGHLVGAVFLFAVGIGLG